MTEIMKEINALYVTYPALFTVIALYNILILGLKLIGFVIGAMNEWAAK